MEKPKKITPAKIFLALLILLVIALIFFIAKEVRNPLNKDFVQIREYLLELTPIGTSMNEVEQLIKDNNKMEIHYVSNKSGMKIVTTLTDYTEQTGVPSIYESGERIGSQTIYAMVGTYLKINLKQIPVEAFFVFDDDSKLIEILIDKKAGLLSSAPVD